MSLYIIDNAGEFVHMERMDGQVYNNIRTALFKAQSALKTRQPTSISAAQLKNNPAGIAAFNRLFQFVHHLGRRPDRGRRANDRRNRRRRRYGADTVMGERIENCAIEGLKATFGEHVTLPIYPAAGESR